ncbi:MAG: hypothetical protein QXI33_03380 [Candidatus Pacearchaeota archaeon]
MKIKNIIIGLAITILTSFVAIYGILAFYGDAPQWDNYCGNIQSPLYEINTSQHCEAIGGKWNPTYTNKYAQPIPAKTLPEGYCDLYYYCNMELQEAQKIYSKNLFLITVPVGVVLLVIGGALFGLEAVGSGIMLGGIVTLIYGAGSYWPNANNLFRFLTSLVGLILVIILAYWLNKKYEKQSRSFLNNLMKLSKKRY